MLIVNLLLKSACAMNLFEIPMNLFEIPMNLSKIHWNKQHLPGGLIINDPPGSPGRPLPAARPTATSLHRKSFNVHNKITTYYTLCMNYTFPIGKLRHFEG